MVTDSGLERIEHSSHRGLENDHSPRWEMKKVTPVNLARKEFLLGGGNNSFFTASSEIQLLIFLGDSELDINTFTKSFSQSYSLHAPEN